jgi:hypothetical protein
MPVLIRELNVKINVGANESAALRRDDAASVDRQEQALTLKVIDEVLRIQLLKKER